MEKEMKHEQYTELIDELHKEESTELDEELSEVLIAISVISKRLARKLIERSKTNS